MIGSNAENTNFMADSDNTLKIQIDLEGKAAAAQAELNDTCVTAKALGEQSDELGKKTEDAGEKASRAGAKQKALDSVIGELNRIMPGLGHAMSLLAEAYIESGEAAAVGTEGAVTFGTALEGLTRSAGVIIAIGLALEAGRQLWEDFR